AKTIKIQCMMFIVTDSSWERYKISGTVCTTQYFAHSLQNNVEKIPDQGVGRAVKHSDSCLEVDENTIRKFIVSVLSEDESD
ncbi:hypothetical protein L9F63_018872, partial [Diploptera punctata]